MRKLLIVTGSKSDFPKLSGIKKLLRENKVAFDVVAISCHRNIRLLIDELAPSKLHEKDIGVIIAVAHSVANLPAIIAGYLKDSAIHVIGVGLPTSDIDSFSSLMSVVSIPSGVPLLHTGIGEVGLHNAALCSIKLLNPVKS